MEIIINGILLAIGFMVAPFILSVIAYCGSYNIFIYSGGQINGRENCSA